MVTASTLARRKAVVAASARRHAPRAVPPADEPRAIMAGYVSRLSGVVNALHSETLAALRDEGVRVDAADGDAPLQPGAAARVEARLRRLAEKIVGDRKMIATVQGVGASVFKFSREQWSKQVKASLGIDLTSDPNLDELARAFRAENTKLIRSLCASHVERVRDVLAGAGSGERVETIMKSIREATGASKSRAALIARDQVLSLNGDVAEARHKDLGVTEYIWRTSKDERVRERHRELDGQRISYAEPPIVDKRTGRREHAGRDFQCRCVADPIIDLDAVAVKQAAPPAPTPQQAPAAPVAPTPRPAPAAPRPPAVSVPSAAKTLPPPAVAAAEPAPVFAIPPPPKVPLIAMEPEPLPVPAAPPPTAADVPDLAMPAPPKATAKTAPKPAVEKPAAPKSPAPKVKLRGGVVKPDKKRPVWRDPSTISPRESAPRIANETFKSLDEMPVKPSLEGVDYVSHDARDYPENLLTSDYANKVKQATDAAAKGLPEHLHDALKGYTGAGYIETNEYLRLGDAVYREKFGAAAADSVMAQARATHEALATMPRAPESMTLMRGMKLPKGSPAIDAMASAEEVELPAFGSFTRSPSIARQFASPGDDDVSIVYRARKHSSGVMIEAFSDLTYEREVLFPPGTRFKIVGRQRVGENILVVDMEEIA